MLSLFPELLDWSWYVPFVFRVFLGFYLLSVGYKFAKSKNGSEDRPAWIIFGTLLIVLSISFFAGVYTQLSGVITFAISLLALYFKYKKALFASETAKFYLLLGIVALSLVFLGSGPYAFDLPL